LIKVSVKELFHIIPAACDGGRDFFVFVFLFLTLKIVFLKFNQSFNNQV